MKEDPKSGVTQGSAVPLTEPARLASCPLTSPAGQVFDFSSFLPATRDLGPRVQEQMVQKMMFLPRIELWLSA